MKRWAAWVLLLGAGCWWRPGQDAGFESFAETYVEELLAMRPEWATLLGDHRYDHRLDDYSSEGVDRQLSFQRQSLRRLETMDPARLSEVNRVDYRILKANIRSMIFRLEDLKEFQWNPMVYNVGSAVYSLVAREFAPLPERMASLQKRLQAVPAVVAAAKANLRNPPRIHTETAIQQNQGTLRLIAEGLQPYLDRCPDLEESFSRARQQAVQALEDYGRWLEDDLLPGAHGDFRLGERLYGAKLRHTLESDLSLEEIRQAAMQDLNRTREDLAVTARRLYPSLFPHGRLPRDPKSVVREVLDKLADSHPDNETIVDKARHSLDQVTRFTREHELVTVPEEPIRIIVMPEFQRGVAVAYCDSPGPLEAHGETFYAISPTPADWPADRVRSFFREYNDYMLQELTIHESTPGHYLQIAHSNRFRAPTRIRAVFSSGTFVEGWATYAEQLMAEKGFGGPSVKMQQLKMRLRLIINAIIDQQVHAGGMGREEAMDLMMNEGFQEEGEAAGKWRRACLTSAQLSTYYVGNREINAIREAYEARHGPLKDFKAFHDRMLSFGSPAPKYVRELMDLQPAESL